jgi:hypothetical protein
MHVCNQHGGNDRRLCVRKRPLVADRVERRSVYGGITRTGGFVQAVDASSVYMFNVLAQYYLQVAVWKCTGNAVNDGDCSRRGHGGVWRRRALARGRVKRSSTSRRSTSTSWIAASAAWCAALDAIWCMYDVDDAEQLGGRLAGRRRGVCAVERVDARLSGRARDVQQRQSHEAQYAVDQFTSGGGFVFRVPSLTTDASLVRVLAVGNVADRGGGIYLSDSDASSFGHRMFNCSCARAARQHGAAGRRRRVLSGRRAGDLAVLAHA